MGLTFENPNDLQKMLDKFATVPDPKKTPKVKDAKDLLKPEDPEVKEKKNSKDKKKK